MDAFLAENFPHLPFRTHCGDQYHRFYVDRE